MKRINLTILIILVITCKLNAQGLDNCSDCSKTILTAEQIKEKNIDELQLLINEIYARKGYRFSNIRFVEYFSDQKWYKPIENNDEITLNEIENQNVNNLKERIKYLDLQRKELINQIKIFKKYVLSSDSISLVNQFEFRAEKNYDNDNRYLKAVLNRINLDDIHWHKNKGLYNLLVDNGFDIIVHSISFDDNKIDLQYNKISHSKIIEKIDVYTDYRSETEFMLNWQFEFTNGRLKLIHITGAQ